MVRRFYVMAVEWASEQVFAMQISKISMMKNVCSVGFILRYCRNEFKISRKTSIPRMCGIHSLKRKHS
jgi:hypothetical protein